MILALAAMASVATGCGSGGGIGNGSPTVRLQELWLVAITSGITGDEGTDDDMLLTLRRNGTPILKRTILGSGHQFHQRLAALVPIPVGNEHIDVVPGASGLTVTLATQGEDEWVPTFLMVFGESAGFAFPIAASLPQHRLSTNDPGDVASMQLQPAILGTDTTPIDSVLMLTSTADVGDAGTQNRISLGWEVSGRTRIHFEKSPADTAQDDLERNADDVYPLPWNNVDWAPGARPGGTLRPAGQFTQGTVTGMALRIDGDDAWLPRSVFVFGVAAVDYEGERGGNPQFTMVPLVAIPTWRLGWMSTDPGDSEGLVGALTEVTLPTVHRAG